MPLVYLPCFYTFREAIYNRLPWTKPGAGLASERMVVKSSSLSRHGSCASLASASYAYWSEHAPIDMRLALCPWGIRLC